MKSIKDYIIESFKHHGYGDEFYFRIEDVEKEFKKYNFNNKIIYCNCDNPDSSNIYKYFHDNYEELKIKRLLSTFYGKEPKLTVYDGKKEIRTVIESGDFNDNIQILQECDIVVTSPPYSQKLQEKLIKLCLDNKKDFLFGGSLPLIKNKYVFDLWKNNIINIGYNRINDYWNTDIKVASIWYTTLKTKHDNIDLTKDFNDSYIKYDNYDAIECKNIKDIPRDYKGNIGVPISICLKLNKDQFDIIDNKNNLKINGKNIYQRFILKLKDT